MPATLQRGLISPWQRFYVPKPVYPRIDGAMRRSSTLAELPKEMLCRPARLYQDFPTATPSSLLVNALSKFLPYERRNLTYFNPSLKMPLGYHLVYFPDTRNVSNLLSDGTDTLHSPGPPFTRRMWAGGSLSTGSNLRLDGTPHICRERIVDVQIKGIQGAEKVFVKIDRWIGKQAPRTGVKLQFAVGTWPITEQRVLVFMRDRAEEDDVVETSSVKTLKLTDQPDHSRVMTPTAELFFWFSALTWNAHKLHLDKQYCQEVEGHRNLLVHGPLTLVLMLDVLKEYRILLGPTRTPNGEDYERIDKVEYKNLAPLYADEQMRICVKRKEESRSYSIWIEGRDGTLAVKGIVRMRLARANNP